MEVLYEDGGTRRRATKVSLVRGWRWARDISLAVAGGTFLILVITGLWLSRNYESPAEPWGLEGTITLHRACGALMVAGSIGAVVANVGLGIARKRKVPTFWPVWTTIGSVLTVAAFGTGFLLPYDFIPGSLDATPPTSVWDAAFGDGLSDVIVGDLIIDQTAYAIYLITHVVVLPVLIAVVVGLVFYRRRFRRRVRAR